jgi:uracil-DNA glycosylase
LKNIYKALQKDPKVTFKQPNPVHGDLQSWADQGILMLNAVLTVRAGKSFSHKDSGWAKFTNEVIKAINKNKEGVIFLCWGGKAQEICKEVNKTKHHVLKYGHPSPLAQKTQKFENCTHFSEVNEILNKQGKDSIDWNLK